MAVPFLCATVDGLRRAIVCRRLIGDIFAERSISISDRLLLVVSLIKLCALRYLTEIRAHAWHDTVDLSLRGRLPEVVDNSPAWSVHGAARTAPRCPPRQIAP